MIKVIGIDPDMRKCGVCSLNDNGVELLMSEHTSKIFSVIQDCVLRGEIFAIEDVNQIKTIYHKNRRSNPAVQSRIAQNVGMVKAAATILQDYIEHHGGRVILVPPGIGKQTKNNAKLFKELTGYQGQTNEDTRDAYWIAHWAHNKLKEEIKAWARSG